MSGPPVVAQPLGPGLVLLGPQGVALVSRALDVAAARAARDGIGLPPQARDLRAALAAAGSADGTSGTSVSALDASFSVDAVDIGEVAQVLEVSAGYARRLVRRGAFETGRKVAGCWQVDRIELQQWRDDRQGARSA